MNSHMKKQKLWELIELYRMSGGSEEHHARKERLDAVLDELLAEEQEPVAVVVENYALHWIGSGPIAPLIEKHQIKVGDKLYTEATKSKPWVSLTPQDYNKIFEQARTGEHAVQLADATLKEKNT